jgi:hypothetical protein
MAEVRLPSVLALTVAIFYIYFTMSPIYLVYLVPSVPFQGTGVRQRELPVPKSLYFVYGCNSAGRNCPLFVREVPALYSSY